MSEDEMYKDKVVAKSLSWKHLIWNGYTADETASLVTPCPYVPLKQILIIDSILWIFFFENLYS